MNHIVATNPVAPLPKGISSLGQRLANPVSTYLASKTEAKSAFHLKQTTALEKLMAGLLMGVAGLKWVNPQQPVLGLLAQVGVILLIFEIGLQSNLQILLKTRPQAPTRGLVETAVPFVLGLLPDQGDGELRAFFAVVALFHDVLITIGTFAILALFQGVEVDSLFFIALLTVVRFSVNDTPGIYERVRENVKLNLDRAIDEIVDHAVNQTLAARSIPR